MRPWMFPVSNGCFSCCFPLTLLPLNTVALTWERQRKEQLPFRSLGRQRQYYSMSLRSRGSADGRLSSAGAFETARRELPVSACPCYAKTSAPQGLSVCSIRLVLPSICQCGIQPPPTAPPVCRTVLIICTVYSLLIGIVSLGVRLGVTYVAGTAAEHGQEMLMSFGANNDASPQPLCLFKKETDLDQ